MKIAYVCTNYNNSQFTCKAIASFFEHCDTAAVAVVVDNQSSEPEVKILTSLARSDSRIHLILNRSNVGYFSGLNLGIRWVREKYSDITHIVIGNNDLEFPDGFGARMMAHKARFDEAAVICPDVVTLDGAHQNPHVTSHLSSFRELMYDAYYANYYVGQVILWLAHLTRGFTDRSDETQWRIGRQIWQGHGSCYLLGPLFFANFDELWAPTFMMGEEFCLSKQLSDKQLPLYYEPDIRVVHHYHASIRHVSNRRRWQMARQAHRIYRQYVPIFK